MMYCTNCGTPRHEGAIACPNCGQQAPHFAPPPPINNYLVPAILVTRRSSYLAIMAAATGAWVLYTFAPGSFAFYPRCPFHTLTGLQCPGCGSTRAMHQLLHGNVGAAFRLNPMLFVMFAVALSALPSLVCGRKPQFFHQPWFAWTSFFLLTSYWILRNTPLWPSG